MTSTALLTWQTTRTQALDEIAAAHRLVGGQARGRRFATEQINQAYAVLLSSQFQGFCRDLHSESANYLVQNVPAKIHGILFASLVENRKLDRGNPNPGNIGADFNKLGLPFWDEIRARSVRNQTRQDHLEELNTWRNAIAHQDFNPARLGANTLRLQRVTQWRRSCERLANQFDEVMRLHLATINCSTPW